MLYKCDLSLLVLFTSTPFIHDFEETNSYYFVSESFTSILDLLDLEVKTAPYSLYITFLAISQQLAFF